MRTLWFLDYLSLFIRLLSTQRDQAVSKCAKDAYSQTLGPRHPWVVRQAAKVGMYAAPNRETLMESSRMHYEDCTHICDNVDVIREALWKFYKENKLEGLP